MTYQAQNGENPHKDRTTRHHINLLLLLSLVRAGWRVTPVRKASPMRFRLGGVALVVLWILCARCGPSPSVLVRPQAPIAWTLISRGVKAYASTGDASRASDSSYATWWQARSTRQQWIVYNLNGAGSVGKVLVVWYDDQTSPYDYSLIPGYRPIGLPRDYTLEINAQGNHGQPPATGWTQVVRVTGNTYHSRQHLINMTGRHWLRMSIRTALGGPGATLHLDVYALHSNPPLSGDFLFLGDSITQGPALHLPFNSVVSIPQLIAGKGTGGLPVEEDGGIQDMTPANSLAHLGTWLNLFPGKYVALNYGTNAALHGCMSQSAVFGYFNTMVQEVLARGLIPIIPHILWGAYPMIQRCGPAVNAAIDQIYAEYPQVLRGPDFWEIFQNHPEWLHDRIHPNAIGIGVYRQHYATLLCAEVYQTVC